MVKINKLFLVALTALLVGCGETNTSNSEFEENKGQPRYTISFFEDGGDEVSDIKGLEGSQVTLPTPKKIMQLLLGGIMIMEHIQIDV